MKELEVYVRSYALGKTGIHWRKIENGESILRDPHLLEQRIIPKKTGGLGTIEYVINYQKLSFVLMRHSQQLLCLVAGIEALEERSNELGSTIYNAVAWVVSPDESNSISSENELTLRRLAKRALLSFLGQDTEFINTINEAIDFKGLEEFAVDVDKINQLTENLKYKLDKDESNQKIWDNKSETSIKGSEIFNFAEKLLKTKLPEDDFAILINKVDENEVSVLSIDINPKKPEIPKVKETLNSTSIKEKETQKEYQPIQGESKPEKKSKIKILLVSLILISLLLVTVLVVVKLMEKQQEQPQNVPIPQSLVAPQPPVPVTLR